MGSILPRSQKRRTRTNWGSYSDEPGEACVDKKVIEMDQRESSKTSPLLPRTEGSRLPQNDVDPFDRLAFS